MDEKGNLGKFPKIKIKNSPLTLHKKRGRENRTIIVSAQIQTPGFYKA
jgi:hypothetical protein